MEIIKTRSVATRRDFVRQSGFAGRGHTAGAVIVRYCTRRNRNLVVPDNVEVKKIPRDLLSKCDYAEDVK
jgi:hypothetical protein